MRILVAGAMGEVGRTVADALTGLGHDAVPVSSRAPIAGSSAVSLQAGAELVLSGGVDLVVNAAGRGDRRPGDRPGTTATDVLGPACGVRDVPAVLLSTTRVLEQFTEDFDEDAEPRTRTPYAEANATNERAWLAAAGDRASVLRITNYFCAPAARDSPHAELLPWSLVTEARATGGIVVRSGPSTSREFVSARDVATAVLCLVEDRPVSRICATAPGLTVTLEGLVILVQKAFRRVGLAEPAAAFGSDGPPGPTCRPGWLARQGWNGSLDPEAMTDVITGWLRRAG